jgi:hypothetical protein
MYSHQQTVAPGSVSQDPHWVLTNVAASDIKKRNSSVNPDLDPRGYALIRVAGTRSRRAKTTHKNRKSKEISCSEVLYVLF